MRGRNLLLSAAAEDRFARWKVAKYGPVEGWTAQQMKDVAAASADCEARYRWEFHRFSSTRAEEQRAGEVGAAAAEAAELFLGEMEGQLEGEMGVAAVGEAALGPKEAGGIVVRHRTETTNADSPTINMHAAMPPNFQKPHLGVPFLPLSLGVSVPSLSSGMSGPLGFSCFSSMSLSSGLRR